MLRLETILRVSQFEASSLKELLDYGLERAVEMTQSEIGYIFFYSEASRQFTLHAWSNKAMGMCSILDKPLVYDLDHTGIWGEPVRQRKPVIVNDFLAPNPLKRGYPEGHAPVHRFMTIPVFSGEEIVAVVGMGNRSWEYDETDAHQLTLFMDSLWRIVERRQAEEKLRASEDRFHRLFSSLPVAVLEQDLTDLSKWIAELAATGVKDLGAAFEADPELAAHAIGLLKTIDANDAAVKLFEAGTKSRLLESMADTLTPEGVAAFGRSLAGHLRGTGAVEYEVPARTLSGRDLHCVVKIVLLRKRVGGRPDRSVVVINDVTERQMMERRLQLFSELGKAILGAEPAAETASKAIQRLREIVPCEFVGVRLADEGSEGQPVLACSAAPGVPESVAMGIPASGPWLDGIEEGVPVSVEDLSSFPDSVPYLDLLREHGFRSLLVIPLVARVGQVGSIWMASRKARAFTIDKVGVVNAMANELAIGVQQARLYEKSQAQAEELERRVAERTALLEAANRELESFCYSVSHDLRGPLRAIEGYSAITQEECGEELDDAARDNLSRIRNAAQRMSQLIEDLLALSRFTRSTLDQCEVDLSAMVEEIGAGLMERNPDRKVDWVVAPDVTAVGDSALLRCLLENLLENAWKFTSKTESAQIEFGVSTSHEGTAYRVRDNGCGFDMAYATQLFQPFHRLHRAEEYSGTGVGLATAQRIVARHGGRIWAEGEPNKGATFTFLLGKPGR